MRRGAATLMLLSACTHLPADKSEQVGTRDRGAALEDVPVRGAKVKVKPSDASSVEGELLAADALEVWISAKGERQRFAWADLDHVMVVDQYEGPGPEGALGVWTAVGAAASPGLGFFAPFPFAIWLGIGMPVTVGASVRDHVRFRDAEFLRAYARYPQGLPGAAAVPEPGGPR